MQQQIYQKLNSAFAPLHLEVIDESHLHQGHAGVQKAKESHFRIIIKASQFVSQPKIAIHREINKLLAQELATSIHALAIEILP